MSAAVEEPLLSTDGPPSHEEHVDDERMPSSSFHSSDDEDPESRVASESSKPAAAQPPSSWTAVARRRLVALLLATLVDLGFSARSAKLRPSFEWTQGMEDMLFGAFARLLVHVSVLLAVALYVAPRVRARYAAVPPEVDPYEERMPKLDEDQPDPKRDWERRAYQDRKRFDRLQALLVTLAFLVDTLTAAYGAVKTISMEYESGHQAWIGTTLAITVALANFEFWALRSLVHKLSEETGRLVLSLHNHELFYASKMPGHWCDGCHSRIVGEAYRCKLCDFDACPSCLDKALRKEAREKAFASTGATRKIVTNRVYFARAMWYGRAQWPLFAASGLALIVSTLASLSLPSFTGKILDAVYKQDVETFQRDLTGMVAASGLITGLSVIQYACISVAARRIATSVRIHLFTSILGQDIGFFDGQMSGQLTSRLTNDVWGMVSPWSTILNTCVGSILTLVGGLVMCLHTSWRLSALAVASIGPILFVTSLYASWSKKLNREIYAVLGDANSVATESIQNIRTVRAFSTEKSETIKFERAVNAALEKGTRDALASAGTTAATSFVDLATSALILGFGGWTSIHRPNELSAGDLLKFQLYWSMLDSSWRALNSVVNSLTISAAAAQRVLSLMDSLPKVDLDAGQLVAPQLARPPSLEMSGVTFRYPTRPENLILDNVSMKIPSGQVTALVGPSGGGKSTCVALLLRLYDPEAGRVTLDGVDLRRLNPRSFHRHVGVVSQDTQCFATSVLANVTYGLERSQYTRERVIEATKRANIHDEIMGFEEGYSTKIGERGVRLSGGQRQRLALARVFLRRPALLLLDEATSALDSQNEALVQRSIDELLRDVESSGGGATAVVVAHRLSTVVAAHRIHVVDKGRVIESGAHEELLALGGKYATLVQTQLVGKSLGSETTTGEKNGDDRDDAEVDSSGGEEEYT